MGKYQLLRLLYSTYFGIYYEAVLVGSSDQRFALKVFRGQDHVEVFEAEKDTLEQLRDAPEEMLVLRLVEAFKDPLRGGCCCLVLTPCFETSLEDTVMSEDLHIRISWAVQVAKSLQILHRQGFFHGDLHLSSVVLTTDGKAYLSELCIATPMNPVGIRDYRLSIEPEAIYTARETIYDESAARLFDHTADIYSFGVLLLSFFFQGSEGLSGPELDNARSKFLLEMVGEKGSITRSFSVEWIRRIWDWYSLPAAAFSVIRATMCDPQELLIALPVCALSGGPDPVR